MQIYNTIYVSKQPYVCKYTTLDMEIHGVTTFKHTTLKHATLKYGHLNTGQVNTRTLKYRSDKHTDILESHCS